MRSYFACSPSARTTHYPPTEGRPAYILLKTYQAACRNKTCSTYLLKIAHVLLLLWSPSRNVHRVVVDVANSILD
jgi:hypothetical protein